MPLGNTLTDLFHLFYHKKIISGSLMPEIRSNFSKFVKYFISDFHLCCYFAKARTSIFETQSKNINKGSFNQEFLDFCNVTRLSKNKPDPQSFPRPIQAINYSIGRANLHSK